MSQLESFRQFLSGLNIDTAEKNFAFYFCKKNEYLNSLIESVIKSVNGAHVSIGYGNVNSEIVIIFPNEKIFKTIKSTLQTFLDKFSINYWDIYITFLDKTDFDYSLKYNVLMNEINAINPKVIYFVDNDDNAITRLNAEFNNYNIKLPNHDLLEINKLVNNTEQDRKDLWQSFKYIVNYKDLPK